jgi:hypothetical protein
VGYAYLEPSPTAQLAAGDKVEIHELWSVSEKQDAVNRAISDAWPAFYREVIDETIIIEKFKREYSLASLAVAPRHLVGAYIEPLFRVGQGTASADTGSLHTTIDAAGSGIDTTADLTTLAPDVGNGEYVLVNQTIGVITNILSQTGNYHIDVDDMSGMNDSDDIYIVHAPQLTNGTVSGYFADVRYNIVCPGINFLAEDGRSYEAVVYYGPGAGSSAVVDTSYETTDGVYLDSALSATLTDISEFMIKNTSDVYYNWLGPLTRVRLDQDENPTSIEILYDTYEIWGARLRLVYAANIAPMTSESSVLDDAVAGYVFPRAKYHLYLGRIGAGPQFEVKTAATLADSYDREADKYRDRNRMKRLSGTIKTDQGYINWSDRELPFRR